MRRWQGNKWIDLDVDDGLDFSGRPLTDDEISVDKVTGFTLELSFKCPSCHMWIPLSANTPAHKCSPAIEVKDYKVVGLPQLPEPEDC